MSAETIRTWRKGHTWDDFEPGRVFAHHWGRTIAEADNTLFTTLTQAHNPMYFNEPFAQAHDHPSVVVNPFLVFCVVFGLSVEDLSEAGGPFLGVDGLTFYRPVYPGDTLTARSTVVDRRESQSRKGQGIVTWHTEGFNQRDERVVDFKRSNLHPIGGEPWRI
ncbi:MAG: MaoC family dehydratase [Candidatus Binatia bacterium]